MNRAADGQPEAVEPPAPPIDIEREGLWVFGYGSLMWNPGFEYVEQRFAEISGYVRSFCLWSIHYRGTPEAPGLVLGLAEETIGSTKGVAYRVAPSAAADALRYVRARELVSDAYREVWRDVALTAPPDRPAGRALAVTYVVDPNHAQFADALPLERQADIIAHSVGPRGANAEYLFNTVAHLREIGVRDADLQALDEMVRLRLGGRLAP